MRVSNAERAAGALTPDQLADAVCQLREAGYVILERALEPEWVEELRAALRVSMVKNRAKSHQRLRPEPPFGDARLVADRLAMQVLRACLGEQSLFYTGCTVHSVAPGETSGELHRDRRDPFPELGFALPVWSIQVGLALTDQSEANGATEVWPGSHLIPEPGAAGVRDVQARIGRMPSVLIEMPAGSIVLRDARTLHRWTANHSDAVRTMLCLGYERDFGQVGARGVLLPESGRPRRRRAQARALGA